MPTPPITQLYGVNAVGEFGLYPPPVTGGGGREYEWVVDVGSNWKRAGTSAKDFDKVDHVAIDTGTLTRLTVGCEVDPGAVEIRVSVGGAVHSTHTFTDQSNVKTVSVPVTAGQPLRVEARNVSDPKAKQVMVVLA